MKEFDELAGRIDGMGRALLALAAVLEQAGVIDGPRLTSAMRAMPAPGGASESLLSASRQTLLDLTDQLDDARSRRQSRARR